MSGALRAYWGANLELFPAERVHASFDVIVYGATPGGIVAAIAAKRQGRSVLIVGGWREVLPGGMMSGGLGASDFAATGVFVGMCREFYDRIDAYLGRPSTIPWNFTPSSALAVFTAWLTEAGVQITWTKGIVGCVKEGTYVRKVCTADGLTFAARQWIDASYEGDLLFHAGATLTTGREPFEEFRESLAGVRKRWPNSALVPALSPWRVANEPASGLIEGVEPGDFAEGAGSPLHTQAYNFRMSMTTETARQLPLPTVPPPGYVARRYDLHRRWITTARPRWPDVVSLYRVDTRIFDVNNRGYLSTDWVGQAHRYVTQDYAERERVWKDHESYQRGFLWMLQCETGWDIHDSLRDTARGYRHAADQFLIHHPNDLPNWPTQLYVRSMRRLRGERILTQWDVQRADNVSSGYEGSVIGCASYATDSHAIQRLVAGSGPTAQVISDGGFYVKTGGANQLVPVPWEALIPRRHELSNLSSCWTPSATAAANGMLRLEPWAMNAGMACGVGAAMATEGSGDVALNDLNRTTLRDTLRGLGARVDSR